MTEIMELLKGQLSKMNIDGSWIFGVVSGGYHFYIDADEISWVRITPYFFAFVINT